METLWQDVRVSLRRLRKAPGFTFIAVLSLALGIGANSAIFSLVNTALLRPLPIERPRELAALNAATENGESQFPVLSYPNYKDFRDRNNTLAGLIYYRMSPVSLSHNGANERVWSYVASGNYFEVLGVRAALGRVFTPEDDKAKGAHPVAVLTHDCWQQRFGGDPQIAGRTVIVNGASFTVIGVTPPGFRGSEIGFRTEMWFPAMMQPQIEPENDWLENRDSYNGFVQGRLKPGVTMAQAEANLKTIAADLAREYPKENEGRTIVLSPAGLFGNFMRGPVAGFAAVLMGVVGLVLLLACINLANLLLARATERRKEIAIRLAVGATRARLVRQLLTESVLLALLGGAIGLALAYWLVDAIMTELQMDFRVLLFTMAASLLTGVLFGLLPALQSTRPQLVPALKDDVSVGGYRRSLLRNGMVIGQVTLSLVLLVSAGLVLRGLQQARLLNPGFNPQNAVEMSFDLSLQRYDEARVKQFKRQLLDRVRVLPGVEAAGLTNFLPLTLNINQNAIYIEGQPPVQGGNAPTAMAAAATPGYLQAMGVRLLEGRDFAETDDETRPRVAVVNETFARRFWPGQSALGKRFSYDSDKEPRRQWTEIVGVIQNGKYFSLNEDPTMMVIRNQRQTDGNFLSLVVRASGGPANAIAAIRREFAQLDANLPVYNVKTLAEHMNLPLFPARVAAVLLAGFGLLAMALGAIGLFGVMSYAVGQRTREIGIRMALGAGRGEVFRLVVGQGLLLTGLGIAIGIGLGALGTRLLSSLLYGVSALDPLTFSVVTILLAAVAFVACYFPARRAMRVDPIIALRCE
jgi:macrolide transport system ATP-binding/permease protein